MSSLSPNIAHELAAGLIDDEESDAETVARQLSALLPDGVAAIFEIGAEPGQRFALLLTNDAVYRVDMQVRRPNDDTADDRYARRSPMVTIAVSRTQFQADDCIARLDGETIETRQTDLRFEIQESATRQRDWTLRVPGIDRPICFTTEELLATRSWRSDRSPDERRDAKWEVVPEPDLSLRELFVRKFADIGGWGEPLVDGTHDELASMLRQR